MKDALQIPLTPSGGARCFAPSTAHMLRWSANTGRRPVVCPACLEIVRRGVTDPLSEALAYTERALIGAAYLRASNGAKRGCQ